MGVKKAKKTNKAINLNDCLVLNKYFLSLFGKRDFRELAEDMRSADLEGYNEENTSYFHEFIVRKYVKLGFLNKDKLKEYDENIFRYVQHIGEGRGGLTLKYFQYLVVKEIMLLPKVVDNLCNSSMREKIVKKKITIKEIFSDHWSTFRQEKWHTIPKDMQASVDEAVTKMLGCGDPKNGYTKYVCTECGEQKVVGFTCKSRFCNTCGKVYIENWVNKQVDTIIDTPHRHAVFTVPEELRGKIYWNRNLIKDLSDRVAGVIEHWYKEKSRQKEYEVGIITVVHTFGRDLKYNPHIHALITEGALDKYNVWKPEKYIPYEYLRKAWQKVLLDLMKEKFGHETKMRNLINKLYHKYQKGFYVHAGTRMKNARGAAQYIGRYLARPAIAEYRIMNYDGKTVRFWYEDHQTGERMELELSGVDFVGRLVMHIPQKHFKMVRRYGLYRRDKNEQAKKIVSFWKYVNSKEKKKTKTFKTTKLDWKKRIIKEFGENPIACPKCQKEMELWVIWHPKYGYLYDMLRDAPEVKEDGKILGGHSSLRRRDPDEILQLSLQAM